jgi:hypothetical protein
MLVLTMQVQLMRTFEVEINLLGNDQGLQMEEQEPKMRNTPKVVKMYIKLSVRLHEYEAFIFYKSLLIRSIIFSKFCKISFSEYC